MQSAFTVCKSSVERTDDGMGILWRLRQRRWTVTVVT